MMKEAGVHTLGFAMISGGCCGPGYQLGLTDSLENDVVQEINTIRFAIDPEITATVESITLNVERNDDGFCHVVSESSSCC
ncbi:adhesin [Paenibacillus xylanexedens]|nr:adhesin [Paenibacillus xylanexedens]